ncbi:piggyBac transposable element-derived protein 4-like [Centruroides sculpturatus]|uniref:piggyBac transposable element-derived protein 4-like n=1 Tax=Centruroides sculpturatus TaxID=218467 RepID=UPI000C6E4825|nr:piggyBac transposable element-derived protein 4-like [Centruroides sculpturatus]
MESKKAKKRRYEYEIEWDSCSSDDTLRYTRHEVCDVSDSDTDEYESSESDEGESWSLSGEAREPFPTDSNLGKVNANIPFLDRNPETIFEYFFTQELTESIVLHTNIYARKIFKKKKKKKIREETQKKLSKSLQWKETNCDEVKLFLALLILQGIVKKPDMRLYFTKDKMLATPFFGEIMTRDRFVDLLRFMHFTIDSEQSRNEYDYHFFQFLPLLNHLKEKWQEIYTPERDISIDESLLLWKGRGVVWRTYIPRKRARMGVKSYLLCESSTGYVYDMMIYTGESTLLSNKVKDLDLKGFNKTSRVVLTLMESLLDKGHRLFLDNYYSSPKLYDTLARYKTDVVGTVRMNRKDLPPGMKNKVLKPGEVCSWYRGRLMALKWHDKRDVCMLSTIHDGSMRSHKGRGRKTTMKPAAVLDYNKGMGGVDLADQCISNYAIKKKRMKKFYIKMFLHLVEITVFNSYIIYTKYGAKTRRLNFMLNLVSNLIKKCAQSSNLERYKHSKTDLIRLSERHFITYNPSTANFVRPYRRCFVCSRKKKRKGTMYRCAKCNVSLCAIPCFEKYHTKVQFY